MAGIPANAQTDSLFAIRYDLGPAEAYKSGTTVPFALKLDLAGTSSLAIAPVGDASEVRLASPWPHPSFTGAWSPDERSVSEKGFVAAWRTSSMATGGQARWRKHIDDHSLFKPGHAHAAGVTLFDPVNVYALSYRATEYGFLFVLFTFAGLALVELLAGVRIHAVQYLLVGTALAVFFLFKRSAAFFSWFALLYGTLYVLLKQEDHALLMGSLMVFLALAFAMLATRKVDWDALSRRFAAVTGDAPEGAARPGTTA